MAQSRLDGKVAIVTGGSQGVGASTVSLLVGLGAKVASLDLVEPSTTPSDNLIYITNDVSDEDQVSKAITEVYNKWGRVDILVNNAGITDDNKSAADTTVKIWRRVLSINLDGPMFTTRAALPLMLKNQEEDKGVIVNVCSAAAASGAVAGAAYTSSKHALLGLTRSTAWMYRLQGVRCNAVLPGGIRTNIVHNSGDMIDVENLGLLAPFMACSPGMCEPKDIAEAIVFLVTARNVNGAEINVDKGWLAA